MLFLTHARFKGHNPQIIRMPYQFLTKKYTGWTGDFRVMCKEDDERKMLKAIKRIKEFADCLSTEIIK